MSVHPFRRSFESEDVGLRRCQRKTSQTTRGDGWNTESVGVVVSAPTQTRSSATGPPRQIPSSVTGPMTEGPSESRRADRRRHRPGRVLYQGRCGYQDHTVPRPPTPDVGAKTTRRPWSRGAQHGRLHRSGSDTAPTPLPPRRRRGTSGGRRGWSWGMGRGAGGVRSSRAPETWFTQDLQRLT